MKLKLMLLSLLFPYFSYAQGHIDHIRQQSYLAFKDQVNCESPPGDNLSERICANLALQRSDSLLTLVYDSLLCTMRGYDFDSFDHQLIETQATWRKMREQHCSIIWQLYDGCGSCHQQAIDYLNCMTALTENRIRELQKLRESLRP